MTENEINKLCNELGLVMTSWCDRILYEGYIVGNYYYIEKKSEYKIEFLCSNIHTFNYYTAKMESVRLIKDIKKFIIDTKKLEIEKDFKNELK